MCFLSRLVLSIWYLFPIILWIWPLNFGTIESFHLHGFFFKSELVFPFHTNSLYLWNLHCKDRFCSLDSFISLFKPPSWGNDVWSTFTRRSRSRVFQICSFIGMLFLPSLLLQQILDLALPISNQSDDVYFDLAVFFHYKISRYVYLWLYLGTKKCSVIQTNNSCFSINTTSRAAGRNSQRKWQVDTNTASESQNELVKYGTLLSKYSRYCSSR